ncbi:hypothetical protein N431DRAFT_421083 [Stipitochalara longipes BDJ]|nr:hypothetical protein N431DRAFT_421083 [Stipitochalara longipes BDJ]
MTASIGRPRHSTSSHGSDLSTTAYNPNSNQVTPTTGEFQQGSANRASSFSSDGDEDGDEDDYSEVPEDPVEGWPHVAQLMSKTPDFAAFSRFRDLNIKSLLYYQAQLTTLRKELHEQEYEDKRGADEQAGKFASRADFLMKAEGAAQLKLIKEIREVLTEYNAALLQYSQISALPEPDTYNMKNLRKWLRHERLGGLSISGNGEQNTWGDLYEDPDEGRPTLWKQFWMLLWTLIWPRPPPADDLDLVVTRPQGRIDGFTRWVAWYLIPFYEAYRQHRERSKESARNKRVQSDAERDAKSTHSTPCHNLQRRLEKRKRRRAQKKARAKDGTILSPDQWVAKAQKQDTIETWSEKGMLKFTSGVSTVVACLLPVVAITVLSQVHGISHLLLCIAGFAVIFAVGLIFLTNGTSSRVDIFTATAAFSAVLVVFISNPTPTVLSAPGPST